MNFTQISTFRAVMTSESLSDAAVKLGRTQPAVSAAIKALEDQLGLQLFERRGRKLIPVPEAQYLFAEADAILTQMTRVRQTMQSLAYGQAGTLKVAAMPGPVAMLFPRFIAAKLSGSDDVSVSIQARTSNQIAELTRAQSIDFGFADAPEEPDAETLYDTQIISADSLVALPQGHRLARNTSVSLADLEKEPLGTLPKSHAQTKGLERACAGQGVLLQAKVESQTFLPILHFVAAGQCATVLDPLSVFLVRGPDAMVSGVTVRPMTHPIRYRYAVFSPRYRPISVLARALRDAWIAEVFRLLNDVQAQPKSGGAQTTASP